VLHVEGVNEVRLAAAYFGRLDQPTRKAVAAEAKKWAPMLVNRVQREAHTQGKPGVALAASGKVSATTKGLIASFGTTGAMASGSRRIPASKLAGFEFGTSKQQQKVKYVSRGRSTGLFEVNRRVKAGMSPRRKDGYFIFPAVAEMTPKLVAMWVRAIADVARGGPAGGE
jgi:hypothetical protein